jgi:hypothetical protein
MYMPIISVTIVPIIPLDNRRSRVQFPGRVEILLLFTGPR